MLLYELCWQLGFAHPDMLSSRLTLRQIAGWIAWLRREPRGDRRADVRSAVQTAYLRQPYFEGREDPETFLVRFRDNTVIADPQTAALVDAFLSPQPLL